MLLFLLLQVLQNVSVSSCCSRTPAVPVPAAPGRLLLLLPLQQACSCCSWTPAVAAPSTATGMFLLIGQFLLLLGACCCSCHCSMPVPAAP